MFHTVFLIKPVSLLKCSTLYIKYTSSGPNSPHNCIVKEDFAKKSRLPFVITIIFFFLIYNYCQIGFHSSNHNFQNNITTLNSKVTFSQLKEKKKMESFQLIIYTIANLNDSLKDSTPEEIAYVNLQLQEFFVHTVALY